MVSMTENAMLQRKDFWIILTETIFGETFFHAYICKYDIVPFLFSTVFFIIRISLDSRMWQYLWAHAVFHLVRWFPRNNRTKIFFVVMLLTALLVVPQIVVLLLDHSTRWCRFKLFEFLIVSIVFTLFLIGYTFLFMVMMPVPTAVKVSFHVFGGVSLVISLAHVILTSKAEDCSKTTEALYVMSVILSVFSAISLCFFGFMFPFWIANRVKKNSVLDVPARTGICYEPVKCCSCLWHI